MPHIDFDPYRVLGVSSSASQEQITHAYRSRLRAHHPDTRPRGSSASGESLQRVIAAYKVLRNPAYRAEYDRRATEYEHRRGREQAEARSAHAGPIRIPVTYRQYQERNG